MPETVVRREPWDVDARLAELKLTRKGLLTARDVAIQERAAATPFHCSNAPGTFAYHHGTWSVRDQFAGKEWAVCRLDGIEGIRNEGLKIKVAFSNVDLACNDDHIPKPRSEKGAGAERASGGFFDHLPHYTPEPSDDFALYYLMVDQDGAAELTRPVVRNGTFSTAIERIYLSDGGDGGDELLGTDDIADGFDPQVARKN
ncbi:MAG: hypothetical protein P4L80_18975 [Xanthobacteraceae bacterium]|nr:hypothetical protein [Xanthobacteraceae bacterium]